MDDKPLLYNHLSRDNKPYNSQGVFEWQVFALSKFDLFAPSDPKNQKKVTEHIE